MAGFFLLALCLGVLCGLRAFTPIAVTAVAAHVGSISLAGTPFAFLGTTAAVIITIVLALGEIIVDKLPNTPSRLRPPGLIGRVCLGALTAVAFALAHQHSIAFIAFPLVLGIIGAVTGAFLGSRFRMGLVRAWKSRDLYIALIEDAICILGSLLIVTHSS